MAALISHLGLRGMTRDENYEWKAAKETFCKEVTKGTKTKVILMSIVK